MLMGQGPGEETDTNQTAKQNQKSIKQTHMTIRQSRHQNSVKAENTHTNPSPQQSKGGAYVIGWLCAGRTLFSTLLQPFTLTHTPKHTLLGPVCSGERHSTV